MREFTLKETKYIIEHQDSVTLEDMARKFKCDWHDIYDHYGEVIKTKSYKAYSDLRREKCYGRGWQKIRFVNEEEDESGEEYPDEFLDAPSYATGGRFGDSRYTKDYRVWKRSQDAPIDSDKCVHVPSNVFDHSLIHGED